jgi:hypothetical protein
MAHAVLKARSETGENRWEVKFSLPPCAYELGTAIRAMQFGCECN